MKLCLVRRQGEISPLFGATIGDAGQAGDMLAALAASAGLSSSTHGHGVGDGALGVADQMHLRFGEDGYYLIDFYHEPLAKVPKQFRASEFVCRFRQFSLEAN